MATARRQKQLHRHRIERQLRKICAQAERLEAVDKQAQLLAGLDDGWEFIRKRIIQIGAEDREWAGYPLPVHHARLSIEPRHPRYEKLNGLSLADVNGEPASDHGESIVNSWYDYDRGRYVFIYRKGEGRVQHIILPRYPSTTRARMTLDTLGASQAWSVEAEFTALHRLKTLVTATAFRYYLLTGAFIESSRSSGVFYLFRKCRPTLAFKGTSDGDNCKLLAALCLHPIGYYEQTFAGSMVPTDDVIAHLVMMRGDERKFWSKCNQHDPRAPEAGV